jgi:hypothetical protein
VAAGEGDEVSAVVAKLAGEDPRAADDAGAALEWITGEEGLAGLTQERVQHFCWYELPMKWLIGLEEKLAVAGALGQALELLQLPRYAAICRSAATREIVAAYEASTAQGKATFRRAVAASGIAPPDLPDFAWARRWAGRKPPRGRQQLSCWSWPSPVASWYRVRGAGGSGSGS